MFNILRVIIFWEKYVIILFGKKTQIIQTYIQLYTTQKFNANQKRSA